MVGGRASPKTFLDSSSLFDGVTVKLRCTWPTIEKLSPPETSLMLNQESSGTDNVRESKATEVSPTRVGAPWSQANLVRSLRQHLHLNPNIRLRENKAKWLVPHYRLRETHTTTSSTLWNSNLLSFNPSVPNRHFAGQYSQIRGFRKRKIPSFDNTNKIIIKCSYYKDHSPTTSLPSADSIFTIGRTTIQLDQKNT